MSIQPITIDNSESELFRYKSSLKADYASGVGTVDVYSIDQFAVNKILLIGEIGDKDSEIIHTSSSVTPSGNTVTLAANTVNPHTKDTPVYIYAFDQVEFSHADTLTGTKTVLGSLQTIDPRQKEMVYEDSVNSSGYYFTRYKNSITGVFSDYSDGIPYMGLPANTVGYAIDTAMNELDASFSEKLTFRKLISASNQMLRLVRGKLRSWSKYQKVDEIIDQLVKGTETYAMPDDIYDKNSNKSVLNLRLEDSYPLTYIDYGEYIQAVESGDSSVGTPEKYSISDGLIYVWPQGDDISDGKDLIMDYYTDIETIDSQMDIIKGTKFDMLIPYLKFKIRTISENNGKEDLNDPSYAEFRELMNDAIRNDDSGEIKAFRPRKYSIYGGRVSNNRR